MAYSKPDGVTDKSKQKKGAPPVKPHELNPLVKRRIEKKAHRTVGVEALKAFLPLNDPNRKGFDIGKT